MGYLHCAFLDHPAHALRKWAIGGNGIKNDGEQALVVVGHEYGESDWTRG
jgi:hypothetical protein